MIKYRTDNSSEHCTQDLEQQNKAFSFDFWYYEAHSMYSIFPQCHEFKLSSNKELYLLGLNNKFNTTQHLPILLMQQSGNPLF